MAPNFERPNVRGDLRPRRTSQRQVVTSNVSVGVPVARGTSLDTDAHAPHLSRVRVAGRVGDDLVDHIGASHLVQCLDVLDDSDLMRDPVALGLVLLCFLTPVRVVSTHSISQVPSAQWKRKLTISSLSLKMILRLLPLSRTLLQSRA
jgi:hypothetical protein